MYLSPGNDSCSGAKGRDNVEYVPFQLQYNDYQFTGKKEHWMKWTLKKKMAFRFYQKWMSWNNFVPIWISVKIRIRIVKTLSSLGRPLQINVEVDVL